VRFNLSRPNTNMDTNTEMNIGYRYRIVYEYEVNTACGYGYEYNIGYMYGILVQILDTGLFHIVCQVSWFLKLQRGEGDG